MAAEANKSDVEQASTISSAADEAGKPAAPTAIRGTGRRKVILFILLLGAATWGGKWWFAERFIESTNNAYLQADNTTVAPKVVGYVTEVLVQDNQAVTVGQPLVKLDRRSYQAAEDKANATIAARRADVAHAEAELHKQQSSIEQARAQLQGATEAVTYAEARVKRYAPLIAKGGETADKLEELQNSLNQARAAAAADRAALQSALRQFASTEAQLQSTQAELAASKSSAQQNRIDLDDTIIRSTVSGRVGDKAVRVGQYVQAGTKLMTIVPVQNIYLLANFKETQIGAIRIGQLVSISVDALPGATLSGTVESLAPGTGSQFSLLPPENATGNFTKVVQRVPVRIRLTQESLENNPLVPGLSVTVRVDTRQAPASSQAQRSARDHG